MDGTLFSSDCKKNHHGTIVSSFAAAHTDGGGQLSSIGFNTMMIPYSYSNGLAKAHHASIVKGADIISISWYYSCTPDSSGNDQLIIKEILDNGTVIVAAAGNGYTGASCSISGGPPFSPIFPFSPTYDDRLICVTSTDKNDNHTYYIDGNNKTHSHFSEVDICAPGYSIMGAISSEREDDYGICVENTWPYYGYSKGTSFATPIVAGVAALLKSVNMNLTPAEVKTILKITADPINDAHLYEGLLGSGRVNAYKAVKFAHSNTLVIEADEIVTISYDFTMPADGKIVIRPGAKLIIDGGKITSDNSPWQGIYVEGDRTKPQNFKTQGALVLKNGAIIENAKNAVTTRNTDDNWWGNGGIIQATDATFRNNRRDVEFLSYQNINADGVEENNISFFNNVVFETTDNTIQNNHIGHITMWDVKGVNINNSLFKDKIVSFEIAREGILTADASFDIYRTSFENLKYGIYASASSDHYFRVSYSDFSSYRGIYFNGMDNVLIYDNEFFVKPGYEYPYRDIETYGVYIESAQNFLIENNTFNSTSDGRIKGGSIGLIAKNTGRYANEIYRNDFNGFTVGIEAIDQNKGRFDTQGLELLCNRLDNNAYDIYVAYEVAGRHMGIRAMQGFDQNQ